jgi:hypothetical protein
MRRFYIGVLFILLSAGPLAAQTSNDTFKAKHLDLACSFQGTDRAAKDYAEQTCQSYLRGLTDGLFLMKAFEGANRAGCLPSDSPISNDEARRDFEAYLRQHPESAENSAGLVVAFAIMAAHPCQKTN